MVLGGGADADAAVVSVPPMTDAGGARCHTLSLGATTAWAKVLLELVLVLLLLAFPDAIDANEGLEGFGFCECCWLVKAVALDLAIPCSSTWRLHRVKIPSRYSSANVRWFADTAVLLGSSTRKASKQFKSRTA